MATIFRYNENKALIKAIKSWYSMAHVQNSWLIEILYWSTTHKQKDILRMRSLINYITEKTICQFGRWDLVQVEWIVSILRWISHIPHQTHTHSLHTLSRVIVPPRSGGTWELSLLETLTCFLCDHTNLCVPRPTCETAVYAWTQTYVFQMVSVTVI